MRNLINFLTSKEIIVVYIVAAIACFLAFIIYLIDKNYDKRKQRHNTKELNKLVEQVSEVIAEEEASPVLEPLPTMITPTEEKVELLEEQAPIENNIVLENLNNLEEKEIIEEPVIINSVPEELEYTSIEPNPEQAKEELRKLAQELEEEELNKDENKSIITNYEEEQELSAIISLEELVKKSKEMYAANELSQYKDEGNEPISLEDLEKAKKTNSSYLYDEPFIIANVVTDMENEINKNTEIEQLQISDFDTTNEVSKSSEVVQPESIVKPKVEDLYQTTNFKKSPVISPIYGIEKKETDYLELENTANYEKLDEEIRKTNEFLMTLKELQKNLD